MYEIGKGYILHVYTADCGEGYRYTLQVHTVGGGKGTTPHVRGSCVEEYSLLAVERRTPRTSTLLDEYILHVHNRLLLVLNWLSGVEKS
jgi:hypothetical protein